MSQFTAKRPKQTRWAASTRLCQETPPSSPLPDGAPPSYLILKEGDLVEQFCWTKSQIKDLVLTGVVNQGATCYCYSLPTTESARAALNMSRWRPMLPQLSFQDAINHNRREECKGAQGSTVFEWMAREGVSELNDVPAGALNRPVRELSHSSIFDEWEPVDESEPTIKAAVLDKPIPIVIPLSKTSWRYRRGIIDLARVKRDAEDMEHCVLLVGFGYYICRDGQEINVWICKDSFGLRHGYDGNILLTRNSAFPISKWMVLHPRMPIIFQPGERERYTNRTKVEEFTLHQLRGFETNKHYELIILFYDKRCSFNADILKIFDRLSRSYLFDKDILVVKVDVTKNWEKCRKFGIYGKLGKPKSGIKRKDIPVLRTYKFKTSEEGPRVLRSEGHEIRIENVDKATYGNLMAFLLAAVGGVCWCCGRVIRTQNA